MIISLLYRPPDSFICMFNRYPLNHALAEHCDIVSLKMTFLFLMLRVVLQADYTTTSVDDDGVPNALRHFGLV